MGRYVASAFLALSVLCFILFSSTDLAASALGRHLYMGQLEGFFQGDCSKEGQASVRQLRNILFPSKSSSPAFTISPHLTGLRLSVLIRPFRLEDKDGNITYIEMGTLVLKVEVEGKTMWIMQDPDHSKITVEEPINNVNLLAVLTPLMTEQMMPGLSPGTFPEQPASLQNKSIIDRVSTAQNITDIIMQEYNYTAENSLKQIHSFLSAGRDAALAYNGSNFELGKRHSDINTKTVWSLPPLLGMPVRYSLPGFKELSFKYWHSNESGVAGLPVDKYKTKDIWKPSILCHLTNRFPLDLYRKVQKYCVYLTAPGSIQSKNFDIITSGTPFAATLDVYRPFALPIGGSISVQVNFHISRDGFYDVLQGDTTPVLLLTATLDQLPYEVTNSLVTFINVRTAILLAFLILSCLFLVAAFISFISYRRPRRNRTWNFHNTTL